MRRLVAPEARERRVAVEPRPCLWPSAAGGPRRSRSPSRSMCRSSRRSARGNRTGASSSPGPSDHAAAHRRKASSTAAWMLRLATASPMRCSSNPPSRRASRGCGCIARRASRSVTPSFAARDAQLVIEAVGRDRAVLDDDLIGRPLDRRARHAGCGRSRQCGCRAARPVRSDDRRGRAGRARRSASSRSPARHRSAPARAGRRSRRSRPAALRRPRARRPAARDAARCRHRR